MDSRQPFYTEATRVNLPKAVGEWNTFETTNRLALARQAGSTWVLTGDSPMQLRIYYGDGNATGTVVFFQVASQLYCDMLVTSLDYHHLYRADLAGPQLKLAELDGNWLTNAIAHGQMNLPAPERTAKAWNVC